MHDRDDERGERLLARVRIASPCDARWEDMHGDERARHCASCDRKVYDLSALPAREAEALLSAHGESICATFFQRADGTVLSADCLVGGRTRRRRGAWTAAGAASAASVAIVIGVAAAEISLPDPRAPDGVDLGGAVCGAPERGPLGSSGPAPETADPGLDGPGGSGDLVADGDREGGPDTPEEPAEAEPPRRRLMGRIAVRRHQEPVSPTLPVRIGPARR